LSLVIRLGFLKKEQEVKSRLLKQLSKLEAHN